MVKKGEDALAKTQKAVYKVLQEGFKFNEKINTSDRDQTFEAVNQTNAPTNTTVAVVEEGTSAKTKQSNPL